MMPVVAPSAPQSRPVTTCRLCGRGALVPYLDLGTQPLADAFRRPDDTRPELRFPLRVCLCPDCGLSQLDTLVDPALLFQTDYPYESSTTVAGRAHFAAFARDVVARFGLGPHDLAVDIGSNVGVLVQGFLDAGMQAAGVDPAPNIAELARARGVYTVCSFFDRDCATLTEGWMGPAAVITGTNVLAHVHDLDAFLDACLTLLAPRGVLIFEAPHFLQLVRNLEYDTVYHEHVSYLSLAPLVRLFARYGLEVFDVLHVGMHGGSIRVFVARQGDYPTTEAVGAVLRAEQRAGIHSLPHLQMFARRVAAHRLGLRRVLEQLSFDGRRLAGISAPAKGMTLLNYCDVNGLLEFVTEKAPLKLGKVTPGGRLPVLPDSALVERGIDVGLLLAWNFADEILGHLGAFTAGGGRCLVPIPTPRLIGGA